jgi:hypothetical protein
MKFPIAMMIPILSLTLAGCDVDVQDKGKLPEVEVKEGRMPDVDVRGPEVEVDREILEVPVPDVDVKIPDEGTPGRAEN